MGKQRESFEGLSLTWNLRERRKMSVKGVLNMARLTWDEMVNAMRQPLIL